LILIGSRNRMENSAQFPVTVISPGRVNLLGEHVDYNDGWVLPIAIDKSITITASPNPAGTIKLHARDLGESVEFSLVSLLKKEDIQGKSLPSWACYPAGVASVLQNHSLEVAGVEAEFHSDLPMGAGLSSSAALEVGFAVLWEALGGWHLDRMTLARYAQEAEVHYVGVNCGLMDQFASANGVEGHALLLDTRTFEWHPVSLPAGTAIVIADSRVKHKLVESAYNTRHEECLEAVRVLQTKYPAVKALRDVDLEQLATMQPQMPDNVYRRARHIVSECLRVPRAAVLLEAGDRRGFGKLMFETHASLRDDYEVSCAELDILVDLAANIPGCLGARLTGAGFGGSTVNLVNEADTDIFMQSLREGYKVRTGIDANIFRCKAVQGAHLVV
jgi:galactokinase